MGQKIGRPLSTDTMRIDPTNTVVTPVVAKAVRDGAPPKSTEHQDSATVVELSSAATKASGTTAESSTAKVARISQLISRGEYKVDLDALAARICEDEILGRGDS